MGLGEDGQRRLLLIPFAPGIGDMSWWEWTPGPCTPLRHWESRGSVYSAPPIPI